MLKVGIVGGTGYTGAELLRILVDHPDAEVTMITSRAEAGVSVDELFPSLRGRLDLRFTEPETDKLAQCDVVFFATPHNVAMNSVPELLAAGTRVIDLSADFRIRDAKLWSEWYHEEHVCPDLLEKAVYGLPEIFSKELRDADLVACAGCYPTAIQLGFWPLLEEKLVDTGHLIASAASGVSGAGRQAKVNNLYTEVSENFKAYGVSGHRHLPEINQGLSWAAGEPLNVVFTPHLLPMIRGIHATLYATLRDPAVALDELQYLYEQRFANCPFVDVMPAGSHPETRSVKGSNILRLALHRPPQSDTVVVLAAEDNLVKGASGQAIQCMNLMFGLEETAGLGAIAVLP